MKLLPEEPTPEMILKGIYKAKELEKLNVEACLDEFRKPGQRSHPPEEIIREVYKAMYQAAPEVEHEPVGYVTRVSNGNLIFTDGSPMSKGTLLPTSN